MNKVLIITERDELARSIGRYLRFKEGIEVKSTFPPALPSNAYRVGKIEWVPHTFRKLAAWIEDQAGATGGDARLLNAIVIIDVPSLHSFDDLDPIDRTKDWTAVVGMLILAFPEVHWVLFGPYRPAGRLLSRSHFLRTASFFQDLGDILDLHDDGFVALFDPASLRHEIRSRLQPRSDASYVPLRKHCAAAIDEEQNYAYFNAYTAYRFGFRCHVVTSHGLMNEILKDEGETELQLTFEDIYLNFPDKRQSLSKILTRDKEFRALRRVGKRIFVTGGHKLTAAERTTWHLNNKYLRRRKPLGYYSKVMFKPESGVFDIWNRSGLRQKFKSTGGKAEGFVWPPPKAQAVSDTGGTHSAPGRLLLVAELLIRRAGRILKNAETVPDIILGATLALEAEEYLGHRTPTTSLEAVSLKHQLEVLAECMFYGVEYHLDTKSRFREIESEMESIGVWFRSKTRDVSKLNAEIGIQSELVLSFRNFNQFNEEQATLSRVRHLYRRLWFRRHKSWAWLFYPARWYFDQLLSSLAVFVAALVGWLLAFGATFTFLVNSPGELTADSPYLHGFEMAITSFFGMQPAHDLKDLEQAGAFIVWLTIVLIILSFIHLGIFVSHLYSIIARR